MKFASGSLMQYLHISHSAQLAASTAVDDPEGTLSGFIPAGASVIPILPSRYFQSFVSNVSSFVYVVVV